MKDNTFLKKYLGNDKVLKEDPPMAAPKETYEQTINRYYLWQISGVNAMQADQIKTGNVHIVDKHQPWNVVSAWGLGYFDGGCINQMYNWSQTGDINYLKAAQHFLSKMLEEEIKKGPRKTPPVAAATAPPMTPSNVNTKEANQEVNKEIEQMAKKLATMNPEKK